jgi:hypothetical protein
VVEELRPGYLWRQTVIRFAEVCAVKSRGGGSRTSVERTEAVDSGDMDPFA